MAKFYLTNVAGFKLVAGKKCLEIEADAAGDEYHSITELYEHRYRLFVALLKAYDNVITPLDSRGSSIKCWKARKHFDGTMFEGSFIAGITKTIPSFKADEPTQVFDITYHLPTALWDVCNVLELPNAPKFDGYTSFDVLERILRL